MKRPSILLLSKQRDDPLADEAIAFVRRHFSNVDVVLGKRGDKIPQDPELWDKDYIISYLCGWIIPGRLLERGRLGAINFHPGPPEYPGSGCYNFALYDRAESYGVTCHHMAPTVDSGNIIAVRRFPLFETDNVHSLMKRSSVHLLGLFDEIMSLLLQGSELPRSNEQWQKDPTTRKDMLDLFRVSPDMSEDEIRRRIHAAEHPDWHGAFIDVAGHRFYHEASP